MPAKTSPRPTLKVAFVSRDEDLRLKAARAFDGAPAHWVVELHDVAPPDADVVVRGRDVGGSGIVFDEAEPQRTLEAIAAASRAGSCATVVVTGAGRGVGVTSVALHLAQSFAASERTCLVDLDRDTSSRLRLGLDGASPAEVGVERVATIPVRDRFRIAFAPADAPLQGKVLAGAEAEFSRVVVDAPHDSGQELALNAARVAVLVLPASPTGIARAQGVLGVRPDISWALVLNRLGRGGEITARAVEGSLGHRIALELPVCPALRDAEDDNRLLRSGAYRWRRRVERLARALQEQA